MADGIVEFARKALAALASEKAPKKKEPRTPEYTSPRTLEVALTKPEYGHMYSPEGRDLGVSRSLDNNSGTAPHKAGDTMSGDRVLHNPTKLREKASGEYHKAERPYDDGARTQEHLRKAGMQGAKNQASVAPEGQEWDENGNPVHPYVRGPVTVDNAWDQLTSAPADWAVKNGHQLPDGDKKKVSEAINSAKASAERLGSAQLQKTMSQVRAQPGGEYGAQKGLEFASSGQGAIGKVIDAVSPKVRDIASISREFSNEEDKKRYIEEKQKAGK